MSSDGSGSHQVVGEINMTPFIDIVLVLLVVFVIAAPVVFTQIEISLPHSESGVEVAGDVEKEDPITVTVTKAGMYYIGDSAVSIADLQTGIISSTNGDTSRKIIIRGDKDVEYQKVVDVLDELKKISYKKVSFLTKKD